MISTASKGAFAPLFQNCLFRSDARVDAHDQVAREFSDHALAWRRGRVDAVMYKSQVDRLHVFALQYGAEVDVTPAVFKDFSLVHTSVTGGMEVECDGNRFGVAEGRSLVMSPRSRVRLRWHSGTTQLIVRVPHALMREVGGLQEGEPLPVPSAMLMSGLHASQWALQVQLLLQAQALPTDSPLRRQWLRQLEHNAVLFLLTQQSAAMGTAAGRPEVPARADLSGLDKTGSRCAAKLLDYIERRMGAPIGLEDLARAAGCSVRSLNALTHHHHGVPPMELLRNLRLDAVRTHLKLHPDARVADKALEYGFGHLGRFAAYYKARFGERPSDTLASTRGCEVGSV